MTKLVIVYECDEIMNVIPCVSVFQKALQSGITLSCYDAAELSYHSKHKSYKPVVAYMNACYN